MSDSGKRAVSVWRGCAVAKAHAATPATSANHVCSCTIADMQPCFNLSARWPRWRKILVTPTCALLTMLLP